MDFSPNKKPIKIIKKVRLEVHHFFINNQIFKQSPRKSLIFKTISEQFAGANKRGKLNNPLRKQTKTLFLHRKPKRNGHFWTCQFKSVHCML